MNTEGIYRIPGNRGQGELFINKFKEGKWIKWYNEQTVKYNFMTFYWLLFMVLLHIVKGDLVAQ